MSSTAQTILDKGTALMSEERWVEAINLFLSEPELLTSNLGGRMERRVGAL